MMNIVPGGRRFTPRPAGPLSASKAGAEAPSLVQSISYSHFIQHIQLSPLAIRQKYGVPKYGLATRKISSFRGPDA